MLFEKNSDELTLQVVKTINNFGSDFKEFIKVDNLLAKLLSFIESESASMELKTSTMFCLKNLGFDCKVEFKEAFN